MQDKALNQGVETHATLRVALADLCMEPSGRRITQLFTSDCLHVLKPHDDWVLVDVPSQKRGHAEGYIRPYRGYVRREEILMMEHCRCSVKKKRDVSISSIVETLHSLLGQPYLHGGLSRAVRGYPLEATGFDSSGLIFRGFKENGVVFPRDSFDQEVVMKQISWRQLALGDLLFTWTHHGRKHHVMMFDGEQLLEADDREGVRQLSFEAKFGISMRDFQPYGKRQITYCRYVG
jgi:hypothetical protein